MTTNHFGDLQRSTQKHKDPSFFAILYLARCISQQMFAEYEGNKNPLEYHNTLFRAAHLEIETQKKVIFVELWSYTTNAQGMEPKIWPKKKGRTEVIYWKGLTHPQTYGAIGCFKLFHVSGYFQKLIFLLMGRPLKGQNIPGCSGAISLHLILEYFLV